MTWAVCGGTVRVVKLAQALKAIDKLLLRIAKSSPVAGDVTVLLTIEEQVAISVLYKFGKRLLSAKESVRSLLRAVVGDDELNQADLFGDRKDGGA